MQGNEYGLRSASVSAAGGAVAAKLTGGDALEGALHGVLINQLNHAAHAVKEQITKDVRADKSTGFEDNRRDHTNSNSKPGDLAAEIENDSIERIQVARRKLGGKVKVDVVAHSALLVQTKGQETYLVEYMGDGKVHKTQVRGTTRIEDSKTWSLDTDNAEVSKHAWNIQKTGTTVRPGHSVSGLVESMQKAADGRGSYSITSNNCHMSQEDGRRALGLKVEAPY